MQNLIDASKVRTGVRRWMPGVLATLGVAVAVAGAVGAGLAVADTPSAPAVDISDVPVANLADQSKPNVMLLLDTSDSMKWTHMPDDWEGNATELFPMGYKSALCNTLYYNPDTTYTVPKASDGVADMPTPTFGAAWKDGFDQSKGVVDLPPISRRTTAIPAAAICLWTRRSPRITLPGKTPMRPMCGQHHTSRMPPKCGEPVPRPILLR